MALGQDIQLDDTLRRTFLNLERGLAWNPLVTAPVMDDCQGAIAQLVAHQRVDRQALDLLVIDEVVVILGGQLGQARGFDQLLDLSRAGLGLGLLLLPAVQFLVALDLLGMRLNGQACLAVVGLGLAFMDQALLLFLLFADLLGLLLVDQTCSPRHLPSFPTRRPSDLPLNASKNPSFDRRSTASPPL